SGHPPLHFDLSVFDLFGSVAAGAELHLVPDDLKRAPHRLVEWIRAHALTQWFSVPSALSYLAQFDAVRPHDLPELRRALWGGDHSVSGVGLGPGHRKDATRTAAAFVHPPGRPEAAHRMYKTGDLARIGEDGLVRFLGRADSQVKSRGHRIELGEIETAVLASADVAAAAVVALPTSRFEGVLICCAYVPARGAEPSSASLRRFLAARLPAYMLPARWLAVDRLPTNANGKIDRQALRELFRRDEAHP